MKNPIWLVGASKISEDYLKVLIALKKPFEVIARKKKTALSFYNKTEPGFSNKILFVPALIKSLLT